MVSACMPYEDYFILDIVTTHAVGIALINTVNIVNAATDRELFDYSEAHCGQSASTLVGFGKMSLLEGFKDR